VRSGVRIGIDVGRARVGVSRCDAKGILATPVETVPRSDGADLDRIAMIARELEAIELIVGVPLSLSGAETASTTDARDFAVALARRTALPTRLVDERLSTVSAGRALREAGRSTRSARPVIDQAAAVIILQHALDSERSSGTEPGTLIAPSQGPTSQ
jgi:putative Holliday junction resolvase